jgi:tripartite-type tricarboxylate transporter receptor subunit TctC
MKQDDLVQRWGVAYRRNTYQSKHKAAMNRRKHLLHLAALAASGLSPVAYAQTAVWTPRRPLRIVAGAPGAVLDVAARQIADRIAATLAQPVLVENKPGAGGLALMEAVARASPDGYTLGIVSFVEMTVNPWLFERMSYDPVRDFVPVTALYTGPQVLVAHGSLPTNDLAGLIRLGRAEPGRYMYGSSGIARPPHIFMEKFKLATGLQLPHVPYRGGPPLMQAVIGGEVPLAMEGSSVTVPLVQASRLKALAVTGDKRLAALPSVPTFAEAGVPGIGLAWVALIAPSGTPPAAVARLHHEVSEALRSPEIRNAYELAGRTPIGNTPQELAQWIRRDLEEWRIVVRDAGIKPE